MIEYPMRKRIADFMLALHNQSIAPLWAVANDNLIFDAAMNQKHGWKNKSKKIFFLMKVCNFLQLSDLLIFAVGLFWISRSFLKIRRNQFKKNIVSKYEKIFVYHTANAEDYIFDAYSKRTNASILRVNVNTVEGLEEIGNPDFFLLLKLLVKNSFGISSKIKKLSSEMSLNSADFLTQCALNIGEYVFFTAFWPLAKSSGVNEVTFLASHVAVHVRPPEKMRFQYWSHGLMRISLLVAKLDYIAVVAPEEKQYIQRIFNNAVECELIKNHQSIMERKNNSVLILSPDLLMTFPHEIQNKLSSFITWFQSAGFEIILRPAPRCTTTVLSTIKEKLGDFNSIDDTTVDIERRLPILKPMFVAGLNNTGFFTALSMGILPISFCDPDTDRYIYNMIYPMKFRVLFWPRDTAMIMEAMQSEDNYYQKITELRNYQDFSLL